MPPRSSGAILSRFFLGQTKRVNEFSLSPDPYPHPGRFQGRAHSLWLYRQTQTRGKSRQGFGAPLKESLMELLKVQRSILLDSLQHNVLDDLPAQSGEVFSTLAALELGRH